MKRRDFLAGTLGSLGAVPLIGTAANVPCPSPSLTAGGNSPIITPCPTPTPAGTPSWLQGAAVNAWIELPNTALLASAAMANVPAFASGNWNNNYSGASLAGQSAYSGGCIAAATSELVVMGGGHSDYCGNEIYSLNLSDNAPSWYQWFPPSQALANSSSSGSGVPYNLDNTPAARHTYWNIHFINSRNKLYTFLAQAVWGNGNGKFATVDSCAYRARAWDPMGTNPNAPSAGAFDLGMIKDASENIWYHDSASGELYKWTAATNSWTTVANVNVAQGDGQPYCCDTKRTRMVRTANGPTPAGWLNLGNPSAGFNNVTMSGTITPSVGGLVYDPVVDCFWYLPYAQGSTAVLYQINPTTWTVTTAAVTGSVPGNQTSGGPGDGYFHGRFNYVPNLKGLVFMLDNQTNVYFMRTA